MTTTRTRNPRLLILGVHKASEGYPNVLYRIEYLRHLPDFDVAEINTPFWSEGLSRHRFSVVPRFIIKALVAHIALLLRFLRVPTPDFIYIPYPAVSPLWLLSLIPRRAKRCSVIADAFISIYDTVVNDRGLLKPGHPLARLLYLLEWRAYRRADKVIVDTAENATYLCQLFGLPSNKVLAIPLSTNERDYRPSAYLPHSGPVRVLFIGTLIPLHGAGIIVNAAAHLRHRADIEFLMIGDGQDAQKVEHLIARYQPNLVWKRDWHTPQRLAAEIERADICLGIFGDTVKAQRVCPLKLYAYAAMGRPIITGQTEWLRNATTSLSYSPFASILVSDPKALAKQILAFVDDPALRSKLSENSRRFYEAELCNQVANERFMECLSSVRA